MPPNGCITITTTAVNMLASTIEEPPAKAEQKQHSGQRTPSHQSPATRNPTKRTTATAAAAATTAAATTLRGYQTFQYMLAPPSLATEIVNNIVDMVFYQEPRDPSRAQEDHSVYMDRTGCCVIAYYLGCLSVFPSHALGASRWISAADCERDTDGGCDYKHEHERNRSKNDTANQPPRGDPAFPVLRHFRYSYFWGTMEVDTYHIKITSEDTNGIGSKNGISSGSSKIDNPESFRLVEFFTFASKPFVYSVVIGFYFAVVVGARMAMAKVFQTTRT